MGRRTRVGPLCALAVVGCVISALTVPAAAAGEASCTHENNKAKVRLEDDSSAAVSLAALVITMNGEPCGSATLLNTDEINVKDTSNGGSAAILIDLSGGQFSNGMTEIPFKINLRTGTRDVFGVSGSNGDDFIMLGSDGANLQDDPSAEIEFISSPDLGLVAGRDGADQICARGAHDTGETSNLVWGILGGSGADKLCGGNVLDVISGQGGGDRISGGRGPDVLRGKRGPDRLAGQGDNDHLYGGSGDDALLGGGGVDSCNGGSGNDQSSSC
jgi:Ca2+-binding RTX toxin-like protein